MARKSGNVLRSGKLIRATMWIGITGTDTALSGAGTAALFGGFSAAVLGRRPFTIVRTRGYLHVLSDQVGASEVYGAAFGMSVVSEQAVTVGITAVPTSDTDRDSDLFFLYEEFVGRFEFISGVGVNSWGGPGNTIYFDSKAMRKVNDDEDVVIVVESLLIGSSA